MSTYGVPVVHLVLEGGLSTIHSVVDAVTDQPPVPVVVIDGSGRSADLLATAHRLVRNDG
jgi:transient receptor potential cation channel subfamily M protein 3